ncbi:DUF4097 family beta strand repeat-containing protein [Hymenobacter sp. UYP22]|uniref:DUF4097 family beta strand repeat-containing protein n=1 Tax=Hymenobacter sp. UYP22 TaxID=3156348 RepID=UPI00339A33AB
MKHVLLGLCLLLSAGAALAQKKNVRATPAIPFTLACTSPAPANALQKQHCETRDVTLPAPPAGTALTIDARMNGGISVRAWTGNTVQVRALVVGRAATPEAAKALAAAVQVATQNNLLRAARANEVLDGWSVDYEVLVPAQTDVVLKAVNGSLSVEGVSGNIRLETTNGGLTLRNVNGNVRAQTTNGPVSIVLAGPGWLGPGLEAATVNGSVEWQLPAVYAGTLLARTTRGKVSAELNTKRKSVLPHNLAATLGKGGAQLKVSTVNGSIAVRQPPETTAPPTDPAE